MLVPQEDFEAFDLIASIVYHNLANNQIGVLDALRRPMTFSTARQRQEFIAFDEDDQVFHLRADQVAQIGPLAINDRIYDAQGERYDILVAELQSGGTRWHVVGRQFKLPPPDPEPAPDLAVWLKLDDVAGEIMLDAVGNATANLAGNLTLPGSSISDGAVGRALHFDGTVGGGGPRIVIPDVAAIHQVNPLTVALWLRLDAVGDMHLLDLGTMALYLDAGRPVLRQNFSSTAGVWRCNDALPANQWIHLAFTYQRQANDESPTWYVYGVEIPDTETAAPDGTITPEGSGNKYVGNNAALGEPLAGDLDDLRLYGRILTPTEINALASLGAIQPV